MAILTEFYRTREDGVNLYLTKSDKGCYIRKQGEDFNYDVAIDVEGATFIYEETDKKIEEGKA